MDNHSEDLWEVEEEDNEIGCSLLEVEVPLRNNLFEFGQSKGSHVVVDASDMA